MELTRVDGIGRPIDTERPLPLLLWQQTPEYKKQLKQLARKIDPISVEFRDKLFGCITGNVFDTPNGAHLVEAEPLQNGFCSIKCSSSSSVLQAGGLLRFLDTAGAFTVSSRERLYRRCGYG